MQMLDRLKVLDAIPGSWLDSLLTGDDAVLPKDGNYNGKHIEMMLNAVRARITELPIIEPKWEGWMRTLLEEYSEAKFRAEAHRRGYLLRDPNEARVKLSWHRVEPIPDGVDFNAEALEKLKAQLTVEQIQFETRTTPDGKAVRSAFLRLF